MQPLVIHPRHEAGDPALWEDVASDVMAAIQPKAEALAQKLAADFYGSLLDDIQDNLADNALFNIASRVEAAEREARGHRELNTALLNQNAELLAALWAGAALQAKHFGDGKRTHLALIDWAYRARATIAKAEGRS